MAPGETLGFTGLLRSLRYAVKGVAAMLRSQHNAWTHALATVVVVALGFAAGHSTAEWCWIVLAIMAVWTAEALNTAFELLTDVASPTFHGSRTGEGRRSWRGRTPGRWGRGAPTCRSSAPVGPTA